MILPRLNVEMQMDSFGGTEFPVTDIFTTFLAILGCDSEDTNLLRELLTH
jgi:hypothetical protein